MPPDNLIIALGRETWPYFDQPDRNGSVLRIQQASPAEESKAIVWRIADSAKSRESARRSVLVNENVHALRNNLDSSKRSNAVPYVVVDLEDEFWSAVIPDLGFLIQHLTGNEQVIPRLLGILPKQSNPSVGACLAELVHWSSAGSEWAETVDGEFVRFKGRPYGSMLFIREPSKELVSGSLVHQSQSRNDTRSWFPPLFIYGRGKFGKPNVKQIPELLKQRLYESLSGIDFDSILSDILAQLMSDVVIAPPSSDGMQIDSKSVLRSAFLSHMQRDHPSIKLYQEQLLGCRNRGELAKQIAAIIASQKSRLDIEKPSIDGGQAKDSERPQWPNYLAGDLDWSDVTGPLQTHIVNAIQSSLINYPTVAQYGLSATLRAIIKVVNLEGRTELINELVGGPTGAAHHSLSSLVEIYRNCRGFWVSWRGCGAYRQPAAAQMRDFVNGHKNLEWMLLLYTSDQASTTVTQSVKDAFGEQITKAAVECNIDKVTLSDNYRKLLSQCGNYQSIVSACNGLKNKGADFTTIMRDFKNEVQTYFNETKGAFVRQLIEGLKPEDGNPGHNGFEHKTANYLFDKKLLAGWKEHLKAAVDVTSEKSITTQIMEQTSGYVDSRKAQIMNTAIDNWFKESGIESDGSTIFVPAEIQYRSEAVPTDDGTVGIARFSDPLGLQQLAGKTGLVVDAVKSSAERRWLVPGDEEELDMLITALGQLKGPRKVVANLDGQLALRIFRSEDDDLQREFGPVICLSDDDRVAAGLLLKYKGSRLWDWVLSISGQVEL